VSEWTAGARALKAWASYDAIESWQSDILLSDNVFQLALGAPPTFLANGPVAKTEIEEAAESEGISSERSTAIRAPHAPW
jgi:hypothetical protein